MTSRWKSFGAIALATILLCATLAALATGFSAAPSGASPVHVSPTPTPTPTTPTAAVASPGLATPGEVTASAAREAGIAAARNAFLAAGGNLSDFHPPSINAPTESPAETGGHVVPLYAESPAPMGIGSYGLRSVNGQIEPYILNTTSVEGYFSTTDPWGIEDQAYDAGPQEGVGSQLNVIEVGTTLDGKQAFNGNTNEFWLQNTFEYSGGKISFDLNIWNFSYNPQGNLPWAGFSEFPTSTILHGNGRVSGGELYEEGGASITVAWPFTVEAYINTTVGSYDGSPLVNEVYFNYSVFNAAGQKVCPTTGTCGSYDNVYFNSVTPVTPGSAEIQANGYNYASDGNGTNLDMEFDYGIGDSDAEIANVVYANATLGLLTLNASTGTYQEVPSAYDFGSETGESTQGSYGTWTVGSNGQPIEQYRTGPSLLTGLWNVSSTPGAHALNYANVEPENAWVAIAPGIGVTDQRVLKIDPTFGWFNRGTSNGGLNGFNTWLQPGVYTVEVMLSGYAPVVETVDLTSSNVALNIQLVRDPTSTVYTPIYVFSNAEMAAVATSGSGTAASPYLLWNAQDGSLAPIFGDMSQWPFEVWEGIYVNATTAYAVWDPLPSLEITYPWWEVQFLDTAPATGPLPLTNVLQIYLYHTQNLTIWGSSNISGWFASAGVSGYNIIGNDIRNTLIGDNTFEVSNEGLELTGGGNNTVWGNTFDQLNLYNQYSGVEHPSVGLTVSESGDHIYNNAFYVNNSASSSASYTDYWNVSCVAGFNAAAFLAGNACEPLSYATTVNGFVLTGSIVGSTYQGGNYWATYGNEPNPYGAIPFVNRATSATGSARIGGITTGQGDHGDYAPLITFALDPVTITETGLPSGATWSALIYNATGYPYLNTTSTTTSTSLVFYAPAGAYTYGIVSAAASSSHYAATTATGAFTLGAGGVSIAVTFVTAFLVTFTEDGLETGVVWRVVVSGEVPVQSSTTTATIYVPNGAYTYTVPTVSGYSTGGGSFTVAGAAVSETVVFSATTYVAAFAETGLPRSTSWSVSVSFGGTTETDTSTATTQYLDLANGTYAYSAPATAGYAADPSAGTLVVAGAPPATTTLAFAVGYAVTISESGLPVTDGYAWSFNVSGQPGTSTTATSVVLTLPNGAYSYTVTSHSTYLNPGGDPTTGYLPSPDAGTFTVASAPLSEAVAFAIMTYPVTFEETGLPAGTAWSVSLVSSYLNETLTTTASSLVVDLSNGTYAYAIGPIAGYQTPQPGNFLLWGAAQMVEVTFSPSYEVQFTESGLPGGLWNVTILHMTQDAAAGSAIDFALPNGTYAYSVGVFNGFSTSQSGTLTVDGAAVDVSVAFAPVYYDVDFEESGLPTGTNWSVTIGSTTLSSTGSTITFAETNGTYDYTIGIVSGWATDDSGSVTVSGAAVNVPVPFVEVTYAVTFTESGLPASETFEVTLNGVTQSLATDGGTDTLTFTGLPNGTYAYSIADVGGWHQSTVPYTGEVTVDGAATGLGVTFTPFYWSVTVAESGLPAGTLWTATVDGATQATTSGSLTFSELNGTYGYTVSVAAGGPQTGSVTVDGANANVLVTFYEVTFAETGLAHGTTWQVTANGVTLASSTAKIEFYLANGAYSYSVGPIAGYRTTLSGSFTVSGSALTVEVPWLKSTYDVKFTETGLTNAWKTTWCVTLNGVEKCATGTTSIKFTGLVNGTYSYTIAAVQNYTLTGLAYTGTVTVSGTTQGAVVATVASHFTLVKYAVKFTETGLPSGASWQVTLDGKTVSSTSKSLSISVSNGTYGFTASASGYTTVTGQVTVDGAKATHAVAFVASAAPGLAEIVAATRE